MSECKLLANLERLPPFVIYALAREAGPDGRQHRPDVVALVARRTGKARRSVQRVCCATSWERIDIGMADALMSACGFDPYDFERELAYLKMMAGAKRPFPHLNAKQLADYYRCCKRWQAQELARQQTASRVTAS